MLNTGNVRAQLFNNGALFRDEDESIYEVPRGSGASPMFNATLLVGGMVDGELRTSASSYGPWEMWPGPIPPDGSAPHDCEQFDWIYKVRYQGTWSLSAVEGIQGDIASWPAELGAPVIDGDDKPETYDPSAGDRPAMLGDQMAWWIMNDAGGSHDKTDTPPLGIEVRASAFAFQRGASTYYRYRILNRSRSDLRGMYLGMFMGADLGAPFDDYVGSDSSLGLAYTYNGEPTDYDYGEKPPAIGYTVIRRPTSTIDGSDSECSYKDEKTQGLTSHVNNVGGPGVTGNALSGSDYYNYMRSRFKDGRHLREGGSYGYHAGEDSLSHPELDFIYPGDPTTGEYWSEVNTDGAGTPNDAADRRSIVGVGPFCLGPGDETDVVFALVWAQGSSNLDSVTQLKGETANIQQNASVLLAPRVVQPIEQPESPVTYPFAVSIYPNPAVTSTTLRLGIPRPMDVRIDVFDLLGRRVEGVVNARLDAGDRTWTIHTSDWPAGVYMVRMQVDHMTETRRLVVVR